MVLVPGIQHPPVRLVPSARHHAARGCRAPACPRRLPAGALWSLNLELERRSERQAGTGSTGPGEEEAARKGQAGTGRYRHGRHGGQAGDGQVWGKRQAWVTGRHRGDRQEQADMGDRQTWGGQARGQAGTEGTGRGQADMGPGRQGNTRGCWRRHLGQQSPEGMGTTAVAVLPSVTPEEGPCHQPPWGGASGAPLPGPSGSLCPPWGCHPPTLGCSRTTAARGVTTATAPVRPPGSGSTGRRGSGGGGGGETCGGAGPHLAPPPCPIGCPLPSLSRAPIKGVAERGAPHTGSGGGSGTDMSEVRARCRVAHSNGVFLFPFIFSNGPGENQSREWRGWAGGGGVCLLDARETPVAAGGPQQSGACPPPSRCGFVAGGPVSPPGTPFLSAAQPP